MWRKIQTIEDVYVAGVTFEGRQKWVAKCQAGDEVTLVREPQNKHDHNAIMVVVRGRQVGYLAAEMSEDYAKAIDAGRMRLQATVEGVHEFERDDRTLLGLTIEIREYEQTVQSSRDASGFPVFVNDDRGASSDKPAKLKSNKNKNQGIGCWGCLGWCFLGFIVLLFLSALAKK